MLKRMKQSPKPKRRRLEVEDTGEPTDSLSVGKFFAPEDDDAARIEEYEAMLGIDEHSLNEALEEQPDLFYRVGKILALQISRRDAAKQYLTNQEAIMDSQLRRNVGKSDAKPTDKAIAAQLRVSATVVNASDQLLRMEHSVRQWNNLKEAIVQRGHALRELVNLYVNAYYQTGSVTRKPSDQLKTRSFEEVREHYKRKGRSR
jgi:hypothetical protein